MDNQLLHVSVGTAINRPSEEDLNQVADYLVGEFPEKEVVVTDHTTSVVEMPAGEEIVENIAQAVMEKLWHRLDEKLAMGIEQENL